MDSWKFKNLIACKTPCSYIYSTIIVLCVLIECLNWIVKFSVINNQNPYIAKYAKTPSRYLIKHIINKTLKIAYSVHMYKVLKSTSICLEFCLTKTDIVQTVSNFSLKMSSVWLLFQAVSLWAICFETPPSVNYDHEFM